MEDARVKDLLDWYKVNLTEDVFLGSGGRPIRYAIQQRKNSRGVVVVVSGRVEFLEKYIELCRDLQDSGYSICLFDHYGQGGSGRQLLDSQKGHIDDFSLYVDDLYMLLSNQDIIDHSLPVVILSHSMGGTIGILLTAEYPQLVDGLVMVAPMLQINTGALLPPLLVEAISKIACALGRTKEYVLGGEPFNPDMPFENNELTGDLTRFRRNLHFVQLNENLALGGPTFGWLCQAYRAMREARSQFNTLKCPILLFQGQEDVVVGLKEMDLLCHCAKNCEMVRYPEGRHELLMERDTIRNPLLESIKGFLRQVSG